MSWSAVIPPRDARFPESRLVQHQKYAHPSETRQCKHFAGVHSVPCDQSSKRADPPRRDGFRNRGTPSPPSPTPGFVTNARDLVCRKVVAKRTNNPCESPFLRHEAQKKFPVNPADPQKYARIFHRQPDLIGMGMHNHHNSLNGRRKRFNIH